MSREHQLSSDDIELSLVNQGMSLMIESRIRSKEAHLVPQQRRSRVLDFPMLQGPLFFLLVARSTRAADHAFGIQQECTRLDGRWLFARDPYQLPRIDSSGSCQCPPEKIHMEFLISLFDRRRILVKGSDSELTQVGTALRSSCADDDREV